MMMQTLGNQLIRSRNDSVGLVLTDQHRVHGKKSNFSKLKLWPKHCKKKIIQALASCMLERKAAFPCVKTRDGK